MLHGGDYNPDQWLSRPDILREDIGLMKLSGCNTATVGIFAWTALEPSEGRYEFGWLDDTLDRLAENGLYALLATPSGARPAWMSQKYPEVLRVGANRVRILHGARHNHCYTSPVYREKVREIDSRLAERYASHPALLGWHLSNEYGGECHCDLCQDVFRAWLRTRYGDDLEKLNHAWWAAFWSHTYTDWSQIESPAPHGEHLVHGQNLDWKRFVTHQTREFIRWEITSIRKYSEDAPITTNFMGTYTGLDYWQLAPDLDVVSWDNYPTWSAAGPPRDEESPRRRPDYRLASDIAFVHDLTRSLKGGKPFMLMESTPSVTNWQPVAKLKRPGMHLLSSVQAIAHGSDTVQYFQWRKSRGSSEKFHGAVVDHAGHENTRVFRDVTEVGALLSRLTDVVGTAVPTEVAVVYDWENRWAIDDAQGPRNDGLTRYEETCKAHYHPFWAMGVGVDVVNMDADFSPYRIVVAPMLYMLREGTSERIERFVRDGGIFVTTYLSGYVDEHDLCFLGGFPGPLRKVLGIWCEEIDSLYPDESNSIRITSEKAHGLSGSYTSGIFSELIHDEGAEVLAVYGNDFYAGMPALTVNSFGKGKAYFIASRNEDEFLMDFTRGIVSHYGITPSLDVTLPVGVTVSRRTDGKRSFYFVQNFTPDEQQVEYAGAEMTDMSDGSSVTGTISLPPWGLRVLRTPKG